MWKPHIINATTATNVFPLKPICYLPQVQKKKKDDFIEIILTILRVGTCINELDWQQLQANVCSPSL